MDIKSELKKVVMEDDYIAVLINAKRASKIIEVLGELRKKAKPDRLDNFILDELIDAIKNPKQEAQASKALRDDEPALRPPVLIRPDGSEQIDKVAVVGKIKLVTDKNNTDMKKWIAESVRYAKTNMDVKTEPKDGSVEAFYDWLVENGIVDKDGNPIPRK